MPSYELFCDSTVTPSLDGVRAADGSTLNVGGVTFNLTSGTGTRGLYFSTFPSLDLPPWQRATQALFSVTQHSGTLPTLGQLFRVRVAPTVEPGPLPSLAALAALEAQTAPYVLCPIVVSSGIIWSIDVTTAINNWIERHDVSGVAQVQLLIEPHTDGTSYLPYGGGWGTPSQRPKLSVTTETILNVWLGESPASAGKLRIEVLAAVPYATYAVQFGSNGLTASYTAATTDTLGSIADALALALAQLNVGAVTHTVGSPVIEITSNEIGVPLDFAVPQVPNCFVTTLQEGRPHRHQEFDIELPSTTTGGTWSLTLDWGDQSGTLASLSASITPAQLKAALDGLVLTRPVTSTVFLKSTTPRTYHVILGGQNGIDATVTSSGAALIGNAVVDVRTVQTPRERIMDVIAVWLRVEDPQTVPNHFPVWPEKWEQPVTIKFGALTIGPLAPRSTSAAWTAAAEAVFGVGNCAVLSAFSEDGGCLLFCFQGAEGGRQHVLPTVSGGKYGLQVQRLQDGAGAASNEFVAVVGENFVDADAYGYDGTENTGVTPFHAHKLSINGEQTASFDTDSPAGMVSALEGLSYFSTGDVVAHTPAWFPQYVRGAVSVLEFTGSRAAANLPPLTAVSTNVPATAFKRSGAATTTNEIQLLVVPWRNGVQTDIGGFAQWTDGLDSGAGQKFWSTPVAPTVSGATITETWCRIVVPLELQGSQSQVQFLRIFLIEYTDGQSHTLLTPPRGEARKLQQAGDPAKQWHLIDFSAATRPSTPNDFRNLPGQFARLQINSTATSPVPLRPTESQLTAIAAGVSPGATSQQITYSGLLEDWPPTYAPGAAQATPPTAGWPIGTPYRLPIYLLATTTAVPAITVHSWSSMSLQTVDGSPLLNEIQEIRITADGGTLIVRDGPGQAWSSGTAWSATGVSTANLDGQLEQVYGANTCLTTGAGTVGTPGRVEFAGGLAKTDVPLVEIKLDELRGGKPVTITQVVAALPGVNEKWQVVIDPNVIGGTFRLNFSGTWTPTVAYNADGAGLDTAIDVVLGNSNHATTGPASGPFEIAAQGALALTNLDPPTIDQSQIQIAAGGALAFTLLAAGTGPSNWAEPANWSLGRVPHTHDAIEFVDGSVSVTSGLVQRAPFTRASADLLLGVTAHLRAGQIVRVRSTGTLPAPLLPGVDYHILSYDRVTRRLRLSAVAGGSALALTDAGSGLHTIEVQLRQLRARRQYRGSLGRERRNSNGTLITGPRYLTIGFLQGLPRPQLLAGIGLEGDGARLLNLDHAGSALVAELIASGDPPDGEYPIQLRSDAQTVSQLKIVEAQVGLGIEINDESLLHRLDMTGGRLHCGTGVRCTRTAQLDQYSGEITGAISFVQARLRVGGG